ncbi:MAG: cobalamin-binding protein [Xanthomonadaceae bacterium]|nr:cobalamin-binding protein [Xanthomonadaceae bacterium]
MRIVSLIASSTEIVCELGLESSLVGRSHECDYPHLILSLPQTTETKFPTTGTSPEIDDLIKDIVRRGLSVYRVDEEKLKELNPDVLITQIQCEVCAVSEKDVKDALCNWLGSKPEIVALNPGGLKEIWDDIRKIAIATDVPERGEALITRLQNRMSAIRDKTKDLHHKPTVACIEWIEPLMSAGNWMPELVERAGGINLFGRAGIHSPYMKWEDLVAQDPEVIYVMPCGWGIERARSEMHYLTSRKEWSTLRAVRSGRVYLCDGNQYFNRPGPRVVESLEIMAETLHSDLFHFKNEGTGWVRF